MKMEAIRIKNCYRDVDHMNARRSDFAEAAVTEFRVETGTDDCDAIADLLCDLIHLCAQKENLYGKFSRNLCRALTYFAQESGRVPDSNAGFNRALNHAEVAEAEVAMLTGV